MPIIGRLLVDYAEQEVDLLNCVQVARGYDMNSTLKSMFRVRGEMNRIKIADALGRVPYAALNLGAEFGILIDAFDYCRRIRTSMLTPTGMTPITVEPYATSRSKSLRTKMIPSMI